MAPPRKARFWLILGCWTLYPLFHGDQMVVLQDGTEVALSRRYRHDLETLLGRPSRP